MRERRYAQSTSPGLFQRLHDWVFRLVRRVLITIATAVFILLMLGIFLSWMSGKSSTVASTPAVTSTPPATIQPVFQPVNVQPIESPRTPGPTGRTESQPSVAVVATSVESQEPPVEPMPIEGEMDEEFEASDTINHGLVKQVILGDSIYVSGTDGKPQQVRLRGIDAPESGQPMYKESKAALAKLILNRDTEIRWSERDRTTALIGDVYQGDEWINLKMVFDGWAWFDDQSVESEELRQAQADAKRARRGIWAQPNPISPWEYRRVQHEKELAAISKAAETKSAKQQAAEAAALAAAERADMEDRQAAYSGGGSVHVKGHYRTTKTGKSVFVRPYTRRK